MDDQTAPADEEARKLAVAHLSEMARAGIASARARDFENGYLLLGEVCDGMRAAGEKLPAHVISFYGLCLGLHLGKHREALQLCQAAIEAEPMKADHYTTLAAVCWAGHQRRKAVTALQRGFAIDPANGRLLDLQGRLGRRRDPVISTLDRAHPVNVTLGRIRHAFAGPPRPRKKSPEGKKT